MCMIYIYIFIDTHIYVYIYIYRYTYIYVYIIHTEYKGILYTSGKKKIRPFTQLSAEAGGISYEEEMITTLCEKMEGKEVAAVQL